MASTKYILKMDVKDALSELERLKIQYRQTLTDIAQNEMKLNDVKKKITNEQRKQTTLANRSPEMKASKGLVAQYRKEERELKAPTAELKQNLKVYDARKKVNGNIIKEAEKEVQKQKDLNLLKQEELSKAHQLYILETQKKVLGKDNLTQAKGELEIAKDNLAITKKIEALKGDSADKTKISKAEYQVLQAEKTLEKQKQKDLISSVQKQKDLNLLKQEELSKTHQLYAIEIKKSVIGKDAIAQAKAQAKIAKDNLATVKKIESLSGERIDRTKIAQAELQYLQAKQSVDKFTGSLEKTKNETVRLIRQYESLLVGIYAIKKGYDATLGVGLEYNKMLESEMMGLRLLIVQNLANVDAKGKQLTLQDKYNTAQKESLKIMEEIKRINPETPYNLADTVQVYKALFPQLIRYGAKLEDISDITKKFTIIAKANGLEVAQFIKTVDTAFSGQMAESQLKIVLDRMGMTNTAVKEAIKNGQLLTFVH